MREIALKAGIPEGDIIVETKSRNTIANIKNSIKLLEGKRTRDPHLESIMLITSDFHLTRSAGIFKKICSDRNLFLLGTEHEEYGEESWDNNKAGTRAIVMEALRILSYIKRRKINDIGLDDAYIM